MNDDTTLDATLLSDNVEERLESTLESKDLLDIGALRNQQLYHDDTF